MAAVRSLALVGLCACSNLQGFSGEVPPFATFTVQVDGDLNAVRAPGDTGPAKLEVALVWGEQWLTEALCLEGPGALPLDPRDDAAKVGPVLAAGCRDPFGFVPLRVEANAPIQLGVPAAIHLIELPGADVMVGDITARVAYGSLVVYDDRNGDGTLTLARPNRLGGRNGQGQGQGMDDPTPTVLSDRIYGASFVTMTAPDQRVAYREGAFVQAAFYPRAGCGDPLPGFSMVAAGGFTVQSAIAATIGGTLPPESPASCRQVAPTASMIAFSLQSPGPVTELGCTENNADSSVRYRDPPDQSPDFTNRTMACVHLPSFGTPSDVVELVVTGRSDDSCVGLTHYILKGCAADPSCAVPTWDHSLAPPTWWPC